MKYTKELHLQHTEAAWDGRLQKKVKTYPEVVWADAPNPPAHDHDADYYRIRPERKLRPWKPEEALGKHVRHIKTDNLGIIGSCSTNTCAIASFGLHTYQEIMMRFTQLDGSPCGVEEEV